MSRSRSAVFTNFHHPITILCFNLFGRFLERFNNATSLYTQYNNFLWWFFFIKQMYSPYLFQIEGKIIIFKGRYTLDRRAGKEELYITVSWSNHNRVIIGNSFILSRQLRFNILNVQLDKEFRVLISLLFIFILKYNIFLSNLIFLPFLDCINLH